jgi:hypothetical protein
VREAYLRDITRAAILGAANTYPEAKARVLVPRHSAPVVEGVLHEQGFEDFRTALVPHGGSFQVPQTLFVLRDDPVWNNLSEKQLKIS